MGRLQDKVIILTGGAQGMGKAHAEVLASEGANVIITDINEEAGKQVADALDNVMFLKQDVTSEEDWQSVVATVMEKYGRIDVLINNAGITYNIPLEDITVEQYMNIVNINQVSVFLGTREVAPHMKAQENGSIINISSINGLVGGAVGYTDTKFAVRGMTKAAARELSPHNVRVNSVHPGVIQTPMIEQPGVKEAVEEFAQTMIMMRRIAQAEEVSKLLVFLASDDATYSTGSEFVIDGGVTAE